MDFTWWLRPSSSIFWVALLGQTGGKKFVGRQCGAESVFPLVNVLLCQRGARYAEEAILSLMQMCKTAGCS